MTNFPEIRSAEFTDAVGGTHGVSTHPRPSVLKWKEPSFFLWVKSILWGPMLVYIRIQP